MANGEKCDEEFVINLTIDGTSYEDVEMKVTNPNKTIRDHVNSIVQVFNLSEMDNAGNPIQYQLGQMLEDIDEPEILDFEDEDGREQCLRDYNIQSGDRLHLISVPIAYACPVPNGMKNEYFYDDEEFIIYLTIDGTSYEQVPVRVKDPNKSIREQIKSIIKVFELPKADCAWNPIEYLLGQMLEDSEEPEILDFEDEDGRELSLIDYNISPGDNLYVISVPLAGYACPIPSKMEKEWIQYCLHKKY